MPELIQLNQGTDIITDTTKVTTGFFTGNLGTLAKNNLATESLSATQKNYYYNLQYSSEDQFSVAFGHKEGSGSGAVQETKAVYMHFKNLLVDPEDIASTASDGFQFSVSSSNAVNHAGIEDFMYFIVMDRARMKDRLNKKNWTLRLSGSGMPNGSVACSASLLELTDDSSTVTGTSTVAGVRYNVVSGSDGTVHTAAATKTYGWVFPNMGIIALRGREVSASLPGQSGSIDSASFLKAENELGLGPELNNDGTADNALKFANSVALAAQAFRSEEDQTSKTYFLRTFANDMNYSNNPTFTSGSAKVLRHSDMIGYPHTFITTVGLYQQGPSGQELVAVGKVSGPIQKNYGTEATIKLKLTY